MNSHKKVKVYEIVVMILLSTMMAPSVVYGGCGCSDNPTHLVASYDNMVNQKTHDFVIKQFLKTDEYKTLKKEMANRNLYPDLKNAEVLKEAYSTDMHFMEAVFVDIPFKPDYDSASVLHGRVWAAYSSCGLGAIAQIYSRKTVEDPWNLEVLLYENEEIRSIDIDITQTRSCESDFMYWCPKFGGTGCSLFVAYVTGMTSIAMKAVTGIGCGILGTGICTLLAPCWCESDCGDIPGCSAYPPCICDPWENCD